MFVRKIMYLNHSKYLLALCALLMISGSAMAQGLIPNLGSARSGTSGFQFTKVSVDPRAASLGNSSVADAMDASSLYWNPALAVQAEGSQFMTNQTVYFVDINQYYAAYLQHFRNYAIGFSLQYLDSGEIDETTEFNKFGTGRTFRTLHYNAGLTFSQRLTELFSYGITARFMHERIEEVEMTSGALDFGFFYRVGETGLRFSVGINNFGFDADPSGETERQTLNGIIIEDDFESVTLPTTFILGTAYDVWENEHFNVMLTAQLTNPSDNAERLSIGSEVGYMDLFYLRGGYQFGLEEISLPSVGFGVEKEFLGVNTKIDVSYTTYETLGDITRFGFNFSF